MLNLYVCNGESMSFTRIQKGNVRDSVVKQIRQAIIEGHLKPDDHIVEISLTKELGVSRTPVREALLLLEREGLVVTQTNRGSFVRSFTVDDIEEIFSMRISMENFAAQQNIDRLSDDDFKQMYEFLASQEAAIQADNFEQVRSIDMNFHRFIINRSGHRLLARHWEEIVAQIAALLFFRAEVFPDYDEMLAIRDHKRIIEAYHQRDLDSLYAANQQINNRVCTECVNAVKAKSKSS